MLQNVMDLSSFFSSMTSMDKVLIYIGVGEIRVLLAKNNLREAVSSVNVKSRRSQSRGEPYRLFV